MKIGIDFGTTFSLPAVYVNGNVSVLLPGGAYGIPSVFYRDAKVGVLIGKPAENRGRLKPKNVVRNIKMLISDTSTTSIRLDGRNFTKKEIVGSIINEVIKIAREEMERKQLASTDVEGVVISVPAAFDIRELDFIKKAAEIYANTKVLGFIREPVAAAISYFNAPSAEDEKTVLVYDLGGGTCDVAIVRSDKNSAEWYTVLASDMRRIGGRDWDKVLVELIKVKCRAENANIEFSAKDEEKIRLEALNVKHNLSRLESVSSEVEVDGEVYDFDITREEFEKKSSELLMSTLNMVDSLKNKFGGKIDYIVCVGGSSNMPQVKAAFNEKYPHIELKLFEPEKAIAFGAAIYANHLTEENYLRDICKFSYGARYIENYDKYKDLNRKIICNIIYKDDALPASGKSTSFNIDDGTTSTYIAIYESECKDDRYQPENGKCIGEIRLTGLKDSRKGDATLLTMTIDRSGLMHLKAVDKRTKKSVEADIQLDDY